MREGEYNVFLMDEKYLYWDMLATIDQWAEHIPELPDSTAIFANNTTEPLRSQKL